MTVLAATRPLSVVGGRNDKEIAMQSETIARCEEHAARLGPDAPRFLGIGDSMRMRLFDNLGWASSLYPRLFGEFKVVHIPHNTGASAVVLANIRDWLSCNPTHVFWNCGLHDLAVDHEVPSGDDPMKYPRRVAHIDTYADNLRQIADILLRAESVRHIAFGLNTPVVDKWHWTNQKNGEPQRRTRKLQDVILYNEAARVVLDRIDGIEVLDLFRPMLNRLEETIRWDGVHSTELGSDIMAGIIANWVQGCG